MLEKTNIILALYVAAEKAFSGLFAEHPDEHFYYCTIVMAEGGSPCISAQSEESLRSYLKENNVSDDDILDYKWSWADSDYCAFGYDEYFGEVSDMFEDSFRAVLDDDRKFELKYKEWFDAMETVMKMLDKNGIFGVGSDRESVFVYAEESPPDDEFESQYRERAKRMNPPAVYEKWLAEQP